MTVENGGEQPANDTALPVDDKTITTTYTVVDDGADDQHDMEGEEGDSAPPEEVEVDYEGKKYKLPPELKDAILRQADYTKKTMTVAEERKAIEAERAAVKVQAETHKAIHAESVKVAALDERLAEYEKVDWQTLLATNPELFQQHRFARDELKEQREAASRALFTKQGELAEHENRERGNHVAKVQAEVARLIPEWTPGGEHDRKLQRYGNDLGLSNDDMAQAILRNPKFALQLDRLRKYDDAAKKQKTQQSVQKSLEVQPVQRVGGNGGSASRKTTDPSGDKLSTEEWAKRERERVANRNKR